MLDITTTRDTIKIVMTAVLTDIDLAETQVLRYLTAHKIGVDPFAIRILLREALANAIMHGSDGDDARTVEMKLSCSPEAVRLTVMDEGQGFSPEELPDFDLLQESGRGLALMRIYADDVIYNEKGNCVTMIKSIPASLGLAAGGKQ